MKTRHISITEAKQRLGELVKRAAYSGERIVLEFRGKPQAAIVSCEELEKIDRKDGDVFERARLLRERLSARRGVRFDSVKDIEQLRQERDEQLSGLR